MNDQKTISIDRNVLRWAAGIIGVVALLVALIAIVVSPAGQKFSTVAWVALGIGLLGLAGFVAIDPQSLIASITGRTGQYGLTTALMSFFFVAFIIALFVVIREANIPTWDVTEARKYSLSESTLTVLDQLDDPIHVIAFYPEASSRRDEVDLWLQQYQHQSDGLITYEFVDPDRDPARALQYDIAAANVLVFEQGDRTAQATTLSEREITRGLTQVLLGGDRKMYAITGHGEHAVDGFSGTDYSQIARDLATSNIQVEPLNLLEAGSVPEDADVLLIAAPTGQFSSAEVEAIKAYMDAGGALMFLAPDPFTGSGEYGNGVMGVDISPDGRKVVSSGSDSTARIWDIASGEELAVLRGHASDVQDASFSPDGQRVVTAGFDGAVIVWDAATGEQIARLSGQTDLVSRARFSPDGSTIASVGENQAVNIWDAETYEPLSFSPITVAQPLLALAFSPDGKLLVATTASASGSGGGPIYVWDTRTGATLHRVQLHATAALGVAFSPDSAAVHSVSVDGVEGILMVETGESYTFNRYPDQGLLSVAIAPDGTIAYALLDGTIHLRAAGASPDEGTENDVVLSGIENLIWDVAFSPDSGTLAAAGRDGTARTWDVDSGEAAQVFSGHAITDPLFAYIESEWGLVLRDAMAVETVSSDQFGELTPMIYTYSSVSPITTPLADAFTFMVQARSIEAAAEVDYTLVQTPLLYTSSGTGTSISSWGETQNPYATGVLQFDELDIPGPLALAYSVENTVTGGRVVVAGDADFATNNALTYATFGNARFFVNAANWLAETDDSITLPPPNYDMRLIDKPFSPIAMGVVAIALTCLIPIVVLLLGVVMWIIRRRRR